jgi:hypothetical protein
MLGFQPMPMWPGLRDQSLGGRMEPRGVRPIHRPMHRQRQGVTSANELTAQVFSSNSNTKSWSQIWFGILVPDSGRVGGKSI